ncbi:MAG: response regulator transcription factor [Myxococcales bacterium]
MDLLLIDDHALVREGIRALADATGLFGHILECGSLAHALDTARTERARIGFVILDLGLPDAVGFDALVRLREALPEAPILVVSGGDTPTVIDTAFELGARGYLPKCSSPTALRLAIQSVLGDERYVPPQLLGHGGAARRPSTPAASPANLERLTPRQNEVLKLLAKGYANKEIANALDLSLSTVRIHVSAVLERLGVENRTQAAMCSTAQVLLRSPA